MGVYYMQYAYYWFRGWTPLAFAVTGQTARSGEAWP